MSSTGPELANQYSNSFHFAKVFQPVFASNGSKPATAMLARTAERDRGKENASRYF
jgi:hypothetical protein